MSLQQIRTVNFGKTRTGLAGSVGYTILNTAGSISTARTTTGIYEVMSGSGMYSAFITFPDDFRGTVVWDSGQSGSNLVFASEEYNYESNNANVDYILTQSTHISASVIAINPKIETLLTQSSFISSSMIVISPKIDTILSQTTAISSSMSYVSSSIAYISSSVSSISSTLTQVSIDVTFLRNIEGGRWKIDTTLNQMIFYAEDNSTEVARFNLYASDGTPASDAIYERVRQ